MENRNYEHETAAKFEAEKTEYKKVVRQTLQDVFSDVLDSTELEKRLRLIDNVEFVTPEQMEEIAKANPKDAGAAGLIRYEVSDTEVKRIPVVMVDSSRAETLHTLLHESIHLMSPNPVPVANPMREPDDQYFSDYVGAYRFNRLMSDKSLDHQSLLETIKRHNELFMFWEAVTDWMAADAGALNTKELKEIEETGYFERHWIRYAVQQCPDSDGLVKALKESYVQGDEGYLIGFLRNQTGTQDDQTYDELLRIIGEARREPGRVDDWMTVVNKYFKKTE